MTTGKTIALTIWTFVDKIMSLLFNMLLVTAFLLISWLQSPSAMILEPKKIKSVIVSIVSPSICHEVVGLDAMILVFSILSFFVLILESSISKLFRQQVSSLVIFHLFRFLCLQLHWTPLRYISYAE